MPTVSVADEIRNALSHTSYSGVELASKIGISPVSLSRFKSGSMNLTLEKLEALAAVLGLKIVTKKSAK